MSIEYMGLSEIKGSFVILENVSDVSSEEVVRFKSGGKEKIGRVMAIEGDKAVIQVFEGTDDMSLQTTSTKFTGEPMKIKLSEEILGRVFDGIGRPLDGMGEIYGEVVRNVNGNPINPISREYPRNFIQTGISSID